LGRGYFIIPCLNQSLTQTNVSYFFGCLLICKIGNPSIGYVMLSFSTYYLKIIDEVLDMNKTELINSVATQSELTKKDATKAVDALFETILNTLAKEEKIQLIGFGTFEVRERAARTGRNPQTGEEIQIAASKVPAFKPGKELKEAVK
jgi:DNA-binding protein HU-beta